MHDPNLILRQSLIPILSVVAGIGVLAVLIYWIRAWVHDNEDSTGSTHELLAEYREMNRRGELSDEEYRIIKSRMASQIGQAAPVTGRAAPKPLMEKGLLQEDVTASDSMPPENVATTGPADEKQPESR